MNAPGELYTTVTPVLVRAVQLTEDADWGAIAEWCGGRLVTYDVGSDEKVTALLILNPLGIGTAQEGWESDWVIEGVTGRFFFVPAAEFAATYIRPEHAATLKPVRDAMLTEGVRAQRQRTELSLWLQYLLRRFDELLNRHTALLGESPPWLVAEQAQVVESLRLDVDLLRRWLADNHLDVESPRGDGGV